MNSFSPECKPTLRWVWCIPTWVWNYTQLRTNSYLSRLGEKEVWHLCDAHLDLSIFTREGVPRLKVETSGRDFSDQNKTFFSYKHGSQNASLLSYDFSKFPKKNGLSWILAKMLNRIVKKVHLVGTFRRWAHFCGRKYVWEGLKGIFGGLLKLKLKNFMFAVVFLKNRLHFWKEHEKTKKSCPLHFSPKMSINRENGPLMI